MKTHEKVTLTRRSLLLSAGLMPGLSVLRSAQAADQSPDYPITPVSLTRVDVHDEFWAPRMDVNRSVSIWHCFQEEDAQPRGFGTPKLIEAAAFMLTKRRDPKLEEFVNGRIDRMLASMEPRLTDPNSAVRVQGHFLEAAASWYECTGNRKMLDAALRNADYIDSAYGPGKKTYISEHEGQKIGLVRLYRATGDARYWKLAKFFLDERGKDDYPRKGEYAIDRTYAQDYAPVVKQTEAVGHCVRATFLYIALADIAALSGQPEYAQALDRIWEDAAYRKTYVTGSIGSVRFHEQFGAPYELPNLAAYNETCAAYGNTVWNHRMFLLHRDARYLDVMERVLYNGFLDGVSLSGDRFFYPNPLKSFDRYERSAWFTVPCCPPNVVRLIASLGSYIYATAPNAIYVNLFVGSDAKVKLGANLVNVTQETRYPWDGVVKISVNPETASRFAVHVRIPGWARNQAMPGDLYRFLDSSSAEASLKLNGEPVALNLQRGFAVIEREWKKGDTVELSLPMPVRPVVARPEVKDDVSRVALERGPIVYCAEWPDNGGRALNLVVPDKTTLRSEYRKGLLNEVEVITGSVLAVQRAQNGLALETKPHELVAIPYSTWANRGPGEMQVWIGRQTSKAWVPPVPPDPIDKVTYAGEVRTDIEHDDIGAVYDGVDPISSADESNRYFRLRPPAGEPGWLQYEFKKPTTVSSTEVYWFDDRRFCRLPASWRVLYQDKGKWNPVANREPYGVDKDRFDRVSFEPVTTTAVRLEVEPQRIVYKAGRVGPPLAMFVNADTEWRESGILEWRVQ